MLERGLWLRGLLLAGLLVVVSVLCASAQGTEIGCIRIDKSKPSIFISFVGRPTKSVEKSSTKEMLLKLNNNTTCPISAETNENDYGDEDKYDPVTSQEGSTTVTRYLQKDIDGLEFPVSYDIKPSRDKSQGWKSGNYWADRHIVFACTVKGGWSIVFPIKSEHLRKGIDISVSFKYAWEDFHGGELTSHRVVYLQEFPEGFYKPK